MRSLRLMTLLVAVLGAAISLKGAWIPVKAWAAYRFMDSALERSAASGQPAKPWSWADFGVVGTMSVGGDRLHILDRATGQALAFGAGLHEEHGFPADPVILSGHRDTHFSVLEALKTGDEIKYTELGKARRYRVVETRIFDLREGTIAMPPEGSLLLITCWPFGAIDPNTSKRYLLLATAVDPQEA